MTTARQLPLSRLGHLVPPLVDNASLIGLIPVTDDAQWAAKAAWDIARIAARDGRRVALVDLCLEHPVLHETVGLKATEGIVDAFEYGVSLNKAAHEVTATTRTGIAHTAPWVKFSPSMPKAWSNLAR